MNLNVFGKVFLSLLVVSLLGYSFNQIGVQGKMIDSLLKLLAFDLAISLIAAWSYPYARGIRKNDQLIAQISRQVAHDNIVHNHIDTVLVTSLQDGRIGGKIHVRLLNGKRAEGVISAYAGTFSPAAIRLTESEM
ncbi:MAG TPA: hypothetical protein VJI13_01405 [Candidatus Norongarragalinales archaeon]|nr:hypothetical protein [Candidatus Norongarragalinales archaeon]